MNWICPECEYENEDVLFRCVCGYDIADDLTAEENDSVAVSKKADQIVFTAYEPHEVVEILKEQLDSIPDGLQFINIFKLGETSPVCGIVDENGFELRNSRLSSFSLRAYGNFNSNKKGTIIKLNFEKPISPYFIWAFILRRYHYDKKIFIDFLKEWLKIIEIAEHNL